MSSPAENKPLGATLMVVAVLLALASPCAAQMGQLFEDYGASARDSAMGNTGTAAANDWAAAFYNPSALVRAQGLAIHFGYKGVFPDLYMEIGRFHEKKFTRYPHTNFLLMGISWNVSAESLIDPKYTDWLTLGLAFALSDYYKSFAIPYDHDSPYYFRYHDRYLNLLSMYFSFSARITEWFSLGGGIVPAPCDTYSDALVDSNIQLPNYKFWADQGTITRSYGKLEPLAGVLFRIPSKERSDYCSIGLTWRDEVYSIDGNGVATDFTKIHYNGATIPMTPSETPMLTLTGWTPMQVVGGFSWRPTEDMTLTADELWKRWSWFRNFFNELPEPRFRDTWNTRFGAENVFHLENAVLESVAARAGLYRENSPAPDQNGQSNYIDPDKWVITAGFDTAWNDPLKIFRVPIRIAAAGQLHLMDRMRIGNERDPDYPPIEAWGNVYSVTATIGVNTK